MKLIKDFGEMTVSSNIDLTVGMSKRELEKDVYEYEFLINWDEMQAKDINSKVNLLWTLPCMKRSTIKRLAVTMAMTMTVGTALTGCGSKTETTATTAQGKQQETGQTSGAAGETAEAKRALARFRL